MSSETWIVKTRNDKGHLIHLVTLPFKPSEKSLSKYGQGEYTIQKNYPTFSKSEKVIIKSVDRIEDNKIQLQPFNINKPQDLDINKKPDLKIQNSLSEHDKNMEDIKKMLSKWDQKSAEKLKPVNVPKTEPLKKLLSNDDQIVIGPKTAESNVIKEDPNVIQPDSINESKTHIKNTIQKKEIYCPRCLDKICDEDFLRYWKDNFKKCDFCNDYFHNKCYDDHQCPNSAICTNCRERILKENMVMAGYCRKSYCSQRCVDNCYEKNQYKSKCKGCGEEEEESEDTEKDEDNNIDIEEDSMICPYCDDEIVDFDEDQYICENCQCSFCSWQCFYRYHKRIGKTKHRGFTLKECMESV